MRRESHHISLSFLDAIIGFLGSILFLFIAVEKGGGNIELPNDLPVVYADYTLKGELINIVYPDSIDLVSGQSFTIVLNSESELETKPCPELDCSECVVNSPKGPICPNPDHHTKKVCPDPSVHDTHDISIPPGPIACLLTHCDDSECKERVKEVIKEVVRVVHDPISISYKMGFAIKDEVGMDRDIDIQVCSSQGPCVDGLRKKNGALQWINLRRGLLKGIVKGGEIVISQEMIPGVYTVNARYGKGDKGKVIAVAATQKNNVSFNHETETLSVGDKWTPVLKVRISRDGTIKKMK